METYSVREMIPICKNSQDSAYLEMALKNNAANKMSEKLIDLLRTASPNGLTIWITESMSPSVTYQAVPNCEYIISARIAAVVEVRQQIQNYEDMHWKKLARSATEEIMYRIRRNWKKAIAKVFGGK